MRGKACSTEFMRRLQKMVAMHEGKHKDLVKFIAHQVCINPTQVTQLLRTLDLQEKICVNTDFQEEPQPTILVECLRAENPEALALKAIEEGWTSDEVRKAVAQEKRATAKQALVGVGTYEVIVADPPWEYQFEQAYARSLDNQYPTMDLKDIQAMNVVDICHTDCTLFLWATPPKLEESLSVLRAWGFTYKTCAVWDKEKIGMGYYFRQQHELILVGTKGNPPVPDERVRVSSVLVSPRTKHSEKPALFYEVLRLMYPTQTRVELFARQVHDGFAAWGNEVEGFS